MLTIHKIYQSYLKPQRMEFHLSSTARVTKEFDFTDHVGDRLPRLQHRRD